MDFGVSSLVERSAGELAATARHAGGALAFVDVGGVEDGVEDSERPSAVRGG